MGFFKKITQGLGIGTAKLDLQVPASIAKSSTEISGTVNITAQSDQKVKTVKVNLVEKTTSTINNETRVTVATLFSVTVAEGFEMKKDEQRSLPFTLTVDVDDSASMNVLGGTLTISASGGGPRNLELNAVADLEGVAIDPSDSQPLTLTA